MAWTPEPVLPKHVVAEVAASVIQSKNTTAYHDAERVARDTLKAVLSSPTRRSAPSASPAPEPRSNPVSHPHFPSYVRTVIRFLRSIGAIVHTTHDRLFRILVRYRGRHTHLDLPRHTTDPARCAARAIARLKIEFGIDGAAA